MKDMPKPDNRRKYDAVFHAEALRLAGQSRSIQAAARALNIDPKRICQWQKAAQTPLAAALGPALARRQTQELEILKSHCQQTLQARYLADRAFMSPYRFIAAERGHYPVRQFGQVLGVPASGFYAWQADQQREVGSDETPAWETPLRHPSAPSGLAPKRARMGRQRTAMRRRNLHQPNTYTPRTTDSTHGMAWAVPPTGCWTSPNLPKPIQPGSRTSPICRSPPPPGLICAPFRT